MGNKPSFQELKKAWESTIVMDKDIIEDRDNADEILARIFDPAGMTPQNMKELTEKIIRYTRMLDRISLIYSGILSNMLRWYAEEVFIDGSK